MNKCRNQSDGRDNQANGERLNRKDNKYRLISFGGDDSERKFLCHFAYDKENQTKYNDVYLVWILFFAVKLLIAQILKLVTGSAMPF